QKYDFQLLIRTLYVYAQCVDASSGAGTVKLSSAASDALLARIMIAPIVVPAPLMRDSRSRKCGEGNTKIELPTIEVGRQKELICTNCECDTHCHAPSGHCICIRFYSADLYIIKEKLARYEAGEIADIENILAGESKVRHHRFLSRSEQTTEVD